MFANVDVNVVESAMLCMRYLYPRLSICGVLVFDDYEGYGQASLLNEFFRDKPVKIAPRTGLGSGGYGLVVQKLA